MNNNLKLEIKSKIGEGGNACVFPDEDGKWVFKLFKSSQHPDFRSDTISDKMLRDLFSSEQEAYKTVSQSRDLMMHAAGFAGNVVVASVVDDKGRDISSWFLLDCCLKLERVPGKDVKLASRIKDFGHLKGYVDLLHASGVRFTLDASVFNPENPINFKIIDFRTVEILDQPT